MNSAQEAYRELVALSKKYLLQEYAITDRILSERESYSYFASFAQQQRRVKQDEQNRPHPPQKGSHPQPPPSFSANHQKPLPSSSPDAPLPKPSIATSTHQQKPIMPPAPHYPAASADPVHPVPPTTIREPSAHHVPPSSKPASDIPPAPSAPAPSPVQSGSPVQHATKGRFQLEPPSAVQPVPFEELRKIIQEKLPRVSLVDRLPDDTEARKEARRWEAPPQRPQVWILSWNDTPKQSAFLVNIEKALAVYGIHAQIGNALKFEQGDKWEELLRSSELQLVIISGPAFHQLTKLKKHYKEDTRKGVHELDGRPLLLLSDLSFYLKEPAFKPALWGTLKQLLPLTPPRP